MMDAWAHVYNCNGESVGQIARFKSLTVKRTVNAPAEIILTLDGRDPATQLLGLDHQVQIWRRCPNLGIEAYKEIDCLYRDPDWELSSSGELTFIGALAGLENLLMRRVLLGGFDETFTTGAYSAEKVMKEVTRTQCGLIGARDGIQIIIPGLTVAGSQDRGDFCSGYQVGTNLLQYLQTICTTHDMSFQVVSDTPGSFIFDAWPIPFGVDRTATNVDPATHLNGAGTKPVIFSAYNGNLSGWAYRKSRVSEGTIAINPDTMGTQHAPGYADSTLNHWEVAVTPTTGEHENSALRYGLNQSRASENIEATIIQTPSCAYGKHYFLGDWVTVVISGPFGTKTLTQIITGVTWSVGYRQGEPVENISIDLTSGMIVAQDPIKEALGNLTRRVKYLELSA